MDNDRVKDIANIAFCGVLILMAAIFLFELGDLKKSRFDFLASSTVPSALSGIIILLATMLALKSARKVLAGEKAPAAENPDLAAQPANGARSTLMQLAFVITSSHLYVVTIVWSLLPYSVSTTLLLAFCMAVLSPSGQRNWSLIIGFSISVGVILEYVFTHLLPLPFPGF